MRWPNKKPSLEWQPWREVFAWWPVKIGAQWVWLEHIEMRRRCYITAPMREYIYEFRDTTYVGGV